VLDNILQSRENTPSSARIDHPILFWTDARHSGYTADEVIGQIEHPARAGRPSFERSTN
jgi:hypothetical protein